MAAHKGARAATAAAAMALVLALSAPVLAQIPGLPITDADPLDPGELRWYLNLDDTLPFELDGSPRWSSKTIDSDLSLSSSNNPYVICEGSITVTNGATLTLEAGVEIYVGSGCGIELSGGHLVSQGAWGDSVIVASIDVVDFDGLLIWPNLENPEQPHITVVGDGTAAPGDWGRIHSMQGSSVTLDYTIIRHGSYGLYVGNHSPAPHATITDCVFGWNDNNGMVHASHDDTTSVITYSDFNHNGDHGLTLDGNSARVNHCNFTGNGQDGMYVDGLGGSTITDCGFYSNEDDGLTFAVISTPVMRDCVFDGNGDYGLYYVNAADSSPPITGCTFTNNHRPMQIPINLLPAKRQTEGDDNIYSPNEVNVIRFIGRPLTGTDYTFPLEVKHKSDSRTPVTTYDFDRGTVTVGSAYTLEFDPGVVLKGPVGQGITVNGDLRIRGTASEPVVFSVTTDDACGNTAYGESGDSSDTNEDGTATTPYPGAWDGVSVSGTGASAVVRHAVFHYGIDGLTCANMDTIDVRHVFADSSYDNGLSISGGLPATVTDVYLEGNLGDGFYIAQNDATVDSLTSRLSGAHGIRTRSDSIAFTHVVADSNELNGLYIEDGSPTLSYATLTNNGEHGLYVQDGYRSPPIEHVTMTGNHVPCRITFSMLSPKRMLEGDTNVYSPNDVNVIEIRGNSPVDTLDHEIPFDVKHAGSRTAIPVTTYHLVDTDLYVPSGYTLAVDPGVVVKGSPYHRLCIFDGRLEAVGAEDQRIVFTSYRDDTAGNTACGQGDDSGDTNDDGASSGAPDDWKGVDVDGKGTVRLEHVDMRYGDDNLNISADSGLGIIAEIKDSAFEDALDDGLYVSGGTGDTLVMEGCRVRDNRDDGLVLGAVSGEVRGCVISGHPDRGVSTTAYIKPAFADNVVAGNGTGFYLYNSAPATLSGNVIAYNDRGVTTGSNNTSVIGGSPSSANSIFGNYTYGVESLDDDPDISATHNWWGAASGPYDPSDDTETGGDYNPGGGGDAVTDDVVYRPWVGSGASGAGERVTLPAGDGTPLSVPVAGLIIDPESGPGGDVTVLEIPVRPPADSTLVMADRHWLILSDDLDDGSFRAKLCFYLEAGDFPSGVDVDSLCVCLGDLSDSSWVALPTTVDADSLKFCVDNVAQTGVFGIGSASATGIDEGEDGPGVNTQVDRVRLFPPSPNPFGYETSMRFEVAARVRMSLRVYTVSGRLAATLVDGAIGPGPHEIVWDGTDDAGEPLPSGVYFVSLRAAGGESAAKMLLLR